MMISNAMTLFIWSSPIAGYKHTAMLLVISVCLFLFLAYKNDNVFSLSISDVCGPTICVRGAWRWGRRGLCLGGEKFQSQSLSKYDRLTLCGRLLDPFSVGKAIAYFVALLFIFASRTSYPIHARNIMLSEYQT